MTKVAMPSRAVPEVFSGKGADLVAEGVSLADAFYGWVRDVVALDAASTLFSGTRDIVDRLEADAVTDAWSSALRLQDLVHIARWMAEQTYDLTGAGVRGPQTLGQLFTEVNAEPADH